MTDAVAGCGWLMYTATGSTLTQAHPPNRAGNGDGLPSAPIGLPKGRDRRQAGITKANSVSWRWLMVAAIEP